MDKEFASLPIKKIEEKLKDVITLKSLNIKVKKGEFVAIIGEGGSGKSSLISSILGDMTRIDNQTLK